MADTNDPAAWPPPRYRFEADLSENLKGISFQEINGMDAEDRVVEYRRSDSPYFSTGKMPDIKKYSIVNLKRGIFANDNAFWNLVNEIKMNSVVRRTIQIRLLDQTGKVTAQWTLQNAWPTKITATDLRSDGNEVVVDALEITHQ
jgi:phage tail-like protein